MSLLLTPVSGTPAIRAKPEVRPAVVDLGRGDFQTASPPSTAVVSVAVGKMEAPHWKEL